MQQEPTQRIAGSHDPTRLAPSTGDGDGDGSGADTEVGSRADDTADGLAPGTRWGRFEIVRLLGRGGMGAVYLARDAQLQRDVALKIMLQGALAGAEERARFQLEATATATLSHPGIVRLYEAGEHAGLPFLAMEYVPGTPLDTLIEGEHLAPRRALELTGAVARALDAAHQRGVIHRDVKPSNILVTPDGQPKLMDFGVARRETDGSQLTQTGAIVGTPAYMSPEQARGEPAGIASDVFGLGAVLYHLLTGEAPRGDGSLIELLRAADEDRIPSPRRRVPRLPRDVETICLRATEPEPTHRYRGAGALADDVDSYLARRPIAARRASTWYLLRRWCQRNRLLSALVLAALVGGPLLVSWWLTRPGDVRLRVHLDGEPLDGARVRVGGLALAVRGHVATGRVAAGARLIEVVAPGCEPYSGALVVTRGGRVERDVELARATGAFDLEAQPVGATVLLDGQPYGSRLRGAFPVGTHELLVRHEGCYDARRRWRAIRHQTRRGFVALPQAVVWSERADHIIHTARFLPDQNGDGLPELRLRFATGLHVIDPWNHRRHASVSVGPRFDQPDTLADLDGDGDLEMVLLALDVVGQNQSRPNYAIREPDGTLLHALEQPPTGWSAPNSRPLVEDLDGDGVPEILVCGIGGNHLLCYDARGTLRWSCPLRGWTARARPFERAGERLLAVYTERELACVTTSGQVRWRLPLEQHADTAIAVQRARYASYEGDAPWIHVVELDGQPGPELLVGESADLYRVGLVAVSGDGRLLWRRRLDARSAPDAELIGDLDGDGRDDILALLAGEPWLHREQRTRPVRWGLVDGRTGATRWEREAQRVAILRAPDGLAALAIAHRRLVRLELATGADASSTPLPFGRRRRRRARAPRGWRPVRRRRRRRFGGLV